MVADFLFSVDVNGQVLVDSSFAGFALASNETLIISGYRIVLDGQALSYNLLPQLLGSGGELSPGVHEFTVVPAKGYILGGSQQELPDIRFSVDLAGGTTLTEAPEGVAIKSIKVFCDVPDKIVTDLQIQTFGSPKGRWLRGALSVSINTANAPNFASTVVTNAFNQWQAVTSFFSFTFVPSNSDIQVSFGYSTLYPRFGMPGGVAGYGAFPEKGRLLLDSTESWTQASLLSATLHEIGHVLGLAHSNDSNAVMFPIDMGWSTIDPESADALRHLYGWRPQTALGDRATSARPAMAVKTKVSLGFTIPTLHMAWKGSSDDQHIYEATFENNAWTPQQLIAGRISSHAPALGTFDLADGTTSTGLLMAWKGGGDDQGLYFASNSGTGWTAQANVPNVGSSEGPALAMFGPPHMAWKGIEDDQGIYWSRLAATGWEPQRRVDGVGTTHSPTLVVFQDRLFMFWKGVEDDSRVYFSSLGREPDAAWQPQKNVTYPVNNASGLIFASIGTSRGPSATQHGNRIMLAWKGAQEDQAIYFSLFDGNEFTGQIAISGVGTSEGPAVCRLGGTTYMAWKGVEDDSVIYVSTI